MSPDSPTPQGDEGEDAAAAAYLDQVMAEIDQEVRRRRATGDLPARTERELDELFLEFSPVAGRDGSLADALRMVDATTFIDPVVPVASAKSGGAAVKKGLRTLSLWYMGFVTHQVSQFAAATARALHQVDDQLASLNRGLAALQPPSAPVVEVPDLYQAQAWWVPVTLDALGGARGRVLHAASGDGFLVQALRAQGRDAYGIDPRPGSADGSGGGAADLRQEGVLEHLRALPSASLAGAVLSGVLEGLPHGERHALVDLLTGALTPEGVLVLHSLSRAAWDAPDAPLAADLAPGRPLRPATWQQILAERGFATTVHLGPASGPAGAHHAPGAPAPHSGDLAGDYLVVATPAGGARPLA